MSINKVYFSVIIPCLNEEAFIGQAIYSLIKSAKCTGKSFELIIVDGGSTDRTLDIIASFKNKNNLKIFHNPKKIVSTALNIGISNATGEYIFRCDAHCTYDKDYFKEILAIHSSNVGLINVGTLIENYVSQTNLIQELMSKNYLVGNSFRTEKKSSSKKVLESDTVPFGSWHRKSLKKIGPFDENFIRSQDAEHNSRFKKKGGKFLLIQKKLIIYFSRDTFKKSLKMFSQYGFWKAQVMKKTGNLYYRPMAPLMLLIYSIIILFLSFSSPIIFLLLSPYFLILFFLNLVSFQDFKKSIIATIMCSSIHYAYGFYYFLGLFVPLNKSGKFLSSLTKLTR